ncbi:glycoside hydrolase family 3 protein, partial [Kibdelosporangium lantanae]
VAVPQDDRWGRTYEGYSEDPRITRAYGYEEVRGIQDSNFLRLRGDGVIATAKHFIGDGGTTGGKDQGVNASSEADMINIHGQGYYGALAAGAQSVMISFNSWTNPDLGINEGKVTGSKKVVTDILKNKIGFDGLVVSDWNAIGQVAGCTNASCPQAINAGIDMVMVPSDWKAFITNTVAQVEGGQIPMSRIDDAVRRVLRLKFQLGLFENPYGDPVNGPYRFHQPAYAALANQASRESMTVLKNNNVLPMRLNAGDNIVVAGPRATDPLSCCIWTSYFHQEYGSLSIMDAIRARAAQAGVNVYQDTGPAPKLAVVAVGEPSYTHATSWVKEQPYLPADQLAVIQNFRNQGIPVVVLLVLPRPYVITEWKDLASAIVVTYRGGEEMGPAAASLLFGDYQAHGKLPWQLPRALSDVLR